MTATLGEHLVLDLDGVGAGPLQRLDRGDGGPEGLRELGLRIDGLQAGADHRHARGCSGCHGGRGTIRAPPLEGVYGRPVPLSDGSTVIADYRYIRDSILMPRSQVVASYEPLMPSFEGKVSEDQLLRLVAYIKSLAGHSS